MFQSLWAIAVRVIVAGGLAIAGGSMYAVEPGEHDPAATDAAQHEKAHHASHGDHIGHANASPSFESPTDVRSDLAFFTFVVFLVLFGVLWKFAWGPIAAGLDKREHSIAEEIEGAKRAHAEAKQLLAEHERKLAGTADEIHAMIERARRDAEHVRAEILAEAKGSADAERLRGVRDIEAATEQALQRLAERSANLAVDLAGKIVATKLSDGDHSRLIQEAMNRFAEAKPSTN
jgi:F-type H+-transporting ATPase subunit b